jgi:chaperonin cofactor prefoldin
MSRSVDDKLDAHGNGASSSAPATAAASPYISEEDDTPPIPRRKPTSPIETELRLLRQAFVEQGKSMGALQQSVERLDVRQAEHEVQTASMRARFEGLEERVSVMEQKIHSMDVKLDAITEMLKMMIPAKAMV